MSGDRGVSLLARSAEEEIKSLREQLDVAEREALLFAARCGGYKDEEVDDTIMAILAGQLRDFRVAEMGVAANRSLREYIDSRRSSNKVSKLGDLHDSLYAIPGGVKIESREPDPCEGPDIDSLDPRYRERRGGRAR